MKRSQQKAMFARLRSISMPRFKANVLPVQVGIIVPSKIGVKQVSESQRSKWITDEKEWFSKQFGADTKIEQVGDYWDGKRLITEKNAMVTSSMTPEKYEATLRKFERHVKEKQKEWKQDTVLARIEGHDFIYPKKPYIDSDKNKSKRILIS